MFDEEEHETDEQDHTLRTLGVHTAPEGGPGGVDLTSLSGMEGKIPIPCCAPRAPASLPLP